MKQIILIFVVALFNIVNGYSQNIVMIGDSHVRGNIYPLSVKKNLGKQYSFTYDGKNGYTLARYFSQNKNKIYRINPDIVIVCFGTNESYSTSYNANKHYRQISSFYSEIHQRLPKAKIIFIGLFGNKLRKGNKYINNYNVKRANEVIRRFSSLHSDCYFIQPCSIKECYYQRDQVHLTVKGYQILGHYIGQKVKRYL